MSAFLKAASIGGLVLVFVVLGAGSGSAQSGAAAPPGATSAPPATVTPASSAGPAASAADIKANPDCKAAADIACAWNHCYPLSDKWKSTSACVAGSCKVHDQSCSNSLIQDLLDPDREKAHGG